jgi:hypothetical protein
MKRMTFVRIGGLSSVNYKKTQKNNRHTFEFANRPPKKRGVYAFIFPYVESFYWKWKCKYNHVGEDEFGDELWRMDKKDFHVMGYRKFQYEGWLWCHFKSVLDDIDDREVSGNWVKVHTSELPQIIRKINHEDCKQLITGNCDPSFSTNMTGIKFPKNAYKRGQGGYMSMDHFEVFIEKV